MRTSAIVDVACGDVDDAAPAGLLHMAGRRTREQELGAQIDVEGAVPVLVLVFVDLLADEERGVIDENVDPVMAGDYLGDADARIAKLSWRQAAAVGSSQIAALIPGISRSGFSMGGGLLVGLSNEDAARYGFLLATPVIFAAAALKLPELLGSEGNGVRGPALVAGICAAATTFFAVKFLLKYFQTNRLTPFGVYCIGLGVISTLIFALGG